MSDEVKETEQTEEAKIAAKAQELVKQQEYDKAQQQLDQERANARKAREKAQEIERQNATLADELAATKEQLAEINEKLNRTDLDPDAADIPAVVTYAKQLEEKVKAQEKAMKSLQKSQDEVRRKAEEIENQKRIESAQEAILSDCDEEFGAKYRNEALKLADELVDKGEVPKPLNPLDGYKLMRKCYSRVLEKAPKSTGATATDSGGSIVPADTGIEPGTRKAVLERMKKNHAWKARAG